MHIDGASGFIPVTLGTSPSQADARALLLPELQKLVPEASANDPTPKGFPKGVSWTDAYKMVTGWHRESADAHPQFGILLEAQSNPLDRLGESQVSRNDL